VPEWLMQHGFQFDQDLEGGLRKWKAESPDGSFA
jgi:hypothetical protein